MKPLLGLLLAVSVAVLLVGSSEAYVPHSFVATTQENEISPEPQQHITRIHPSEIRDPSLEQIKAYVVMRNEPPESAESEESRRKKQQEQAERAITYAELYKLLAMWQLQNQQNSYRVDEGSSSEYPSEQRLDA